jgi:thiol:disulfide interchange protein DsbD
MKGVFLVPTASTRSRVLALILMIVILGAGGGYFVGNKFRAARVEAASSRADGDWQPFSGARLEDELRQGHPVFVDFTAAWCLNCKFNEAHVLENSEVRAAFQKNGVTKLKADWTNGDPEITKFLQQFGRVGVPLYVLYPGNSEEPVVFPELLTKNIVLEKLEGVPRRVASQ